MQDAIKNHLEPIGELITQATADRAPEGWTRRYNVNWSCCQVANVGDLVGEVAEAIVWTRSQNRFQWVNGVPTLDMAIKLRTEDYEIERSSSESWDEGAGTVTMILKFNGGGAADWTAYPDLSRPSVIMLYQSNDPDGWLVGEMCRL